DAAVPTVNDAPYQSQARGGLVADHAPGATSVWRTLLHGYERLEATQRGYVWLNKLGPAYLFGLLALLKAWGLSASLERSAGGVDLKLALLAAYQLSGLLFFGLVTTLYVLRN